MQLALHKFNDYTLLDTRILDGGIFLETNEYHIYKFKEFQNRFAIVMFTIYVKLSNTGH